LELLQRYGRYNVYLSIGLTRRGKLIIITPHHPLSCTAGPRLRRPRVVTGAALVLLRKEGRVEQRVAVAVIPLGGAAVIPLGGSWCCLTLLSWRRGRSDGSPKKIAKIPLGGARRRMEIPLGRARCRVRIPLGRARCKVQIPLGRAQRRMGPHLLLLM